jgi:hypothetical protein
MSETSQFIAENVNGFRTGLIMQFKFTSFLAAMLCLSLRNSMESQIFAIALLCIHFACGGLLDLRLRARYFFLSMVFFGIHCLYCGYVAAGGWCFIIGFVILCRKARDYMLEIHARPQDFC